jgi:hypothetical protein
MTTSLNVAMGMPRWCHHHASRLRIVKKSPRSLELGSNAASLKIHEIRPEGGERFWMVEWELRFRALQTVCGSRIFSEQVLSAAFGITDEIIYTSDEMAEEYGADAMYQGHFIRRGDYLNIPGPGTGHDGDPNISIEVDPQIRCAVLELTA